ncbi:hypothetical protein [Pseudomonas sp. FR229a]|uniref:hypothetical protein n=1 Tax=Pseudomonas sp. FR229a TaxID=3040313 RepID=UPI002552F1F9|nr:hypothetical protein [Pseudomonas sp. FR229a]
MNQEALQRAIASLKFVDIFINESTSKLAEGFDPKFDVRSESLIFQTKNLVTSSAVIEGGEDEDSFILFRVTSELGIRIFCKDDKVTDTDEPDVLAMIEATMHADYEISDKSITEDQPALDEFALNNVSYHVWPYWREYVTSQLMRMNMPKVILPMFLRPSNQN